MSALFCLVKESDYPGISASWLKLDERKDEISASSAFEREKRSSRGDFGVVKYVSIRANRSQA